MGHGQEQKTRPEPQVEIQERGEIFFFYRPKVGKKEAHGADHVQRLYIIMRPESGERAVEAMQEPGYEGMEARGTDKKRGSRYSHGKHGTEEVNIEQQPLFRFMIMGRKSLPNPSEKRRPYWGFVEMVTTNADHVKNALKEEEYETKTRGHRHVSAAIAVGEGIYRILRHKTGGEKNHTHLIYKLEFPPQGEKHEPQASLNIEQEGSFIIQIKNPERGEEGADDGGGRGRRQNKRKAAFPAHLQGQLGHAKFGPACTPEFLNFEGCEFLLISASDHIEDELGLELLTEGEQDASCSDLLKTFGDDVASASTSTLFKGIWA